MAGKRRDRRYEIYLNDNAWDNADGMSQAMIDKLYESNKGNIDLSAVDKQWLSQTIERRYREYNDYTSAYSTAEYLSEIEVQARLKEDVKSGKYEVNSSEYNKHEEEYREEFQSKSALKEQADLLLYQNSMRIDPASLEKNQITTISYRGQSFRGIITLKTDDLVIIKTKQGTEVTVSLDSLMKDGNTITPLSRLGDAYRRELIAGKSLSFMANFHKKRDISNTDDGAWLREQNNIAYSQSQAGLLSQYYQIFNDANSKLSEGDDSWAKAFGILDNVGFGIIGSVSSYFYKNNAVQGLNSYQEQVYRNRFDGRVAHYSDKYSTALMAVDLAQTLLTGGAGVLAKLGGAALKLGSMVAKTSGGLIAKYGAGLGSSMMALPFFLKKGGKFGKLRKKVKKINELYKTDHIKAQKKYVKLRLNYLQRKRLEINTDKFSENDLIRLENLRDESQEILQGMRNVAPDEEKRALKTFYKNNKPDKRYKSIAISDSIIGEMNSVYKSISGKLEFPESRGFKNLIRATDSKLGSLRLKKRNGDLTPRWTDSEAKIYREFYNNTDRTSIGQLRVLIDRLSCRSCIRMACNLIKKRPNVKVRVFQSMGSIRENGKWAGIR